MRFGELFPFGRPPGAEMKKKEEQSPDTADGSLKAAVDHLDAPMEEFLADTDAPQEQAQLVDDADTRERMIDAELAEGDEATAAFFAEGRAQDEDNTFLQETSSGETPEEVTAREEEISAALKNAERIADSVQERAFFMSGDGSEAPAAAANEEPPEQRAA